MDLETTLLDPPTSDLQRSPNGNITVDVILFVKVSLSLGWTKSIGKNKNLVKCMNWPPDCALCQKLLSCLDF